MSRIGRAPIAIPAGVEIKVEDNNVVTVKGPKGTLTQQFNPNMAIAMEEGALHVTRPNEKKTLLISKIYCGMFNLACVIY